ncbi:hypothetical protein TNCV_3185031 [Trichonephila clavipes]|nr:hypothetical protein TNCV_3185031 [Trichonephila clavipes]
MVPEISYRSFFLKGEPRSGRTSTVNVEMLHDMTFRNPSLTTTANDFKLGINQTTPFDHIKNWFRVQVPGK